MSFLPHLFEIVIAKLWGSKSVTPDCRSVFRCASPPQLLQGQNGDDGSDGASHRVSAEDQVLSFEFGFIQDFSEWEFFGPIQKAGVKFSFLKIDAKVCFPVLS